MVMLRSSIVDAETGPLAVQTGDNGLVHLGRAMSASGNGCRWWLAQARTRQPDAACAPDLVCDDGSLRAARPGTEVTSASVGVRRAW